MAMKTDFEDANFIASPFVDEIANQGVPGISNEEVERQAIRANQLFLAKQAASDAGLRKAREASEQASSSQPKKPTGTVAGFAGPGLESRADFINEKLLGLKKK